MCILDLGRGFCEKCTTLDLLVNCQQNHCKAMDEVFFLMTSSEKLYTSQGMHMAERIFVWKGTTQKRTGCCLH